MEDNLFDADAYTAPGKTPRQPKQPKPIADPQPQTVEVLVSSTWRYSNRRTPGVVHAGASKPDRFGRVGTYCGLSGVPLTYTIGERVHGCGVCVDRGAPRGRAVS